MTRTILLAAVASLCLGGCSSLPGGDPTSQLPQQILDNLKHCKRTYQASVGGLGVPGGSLYIECPAQPYEAAVEPA
jgi:outer membrane biogenesis lipoprotein LolB